MKQSDDPAAGTRFPLSSWFYRRVAIAIIAISGMALYFLYDGAIGYPKKNAKADLHDVFLAGQAGEPLEHSAPLAAKKINALEAAHRAGEDGQSWAAFAASRKLPSATPKRYSQQKISNQFIYAAILGLAMVGIVLWLLNQRKRDFLCSTSSFTTPTGKAINFSDIKKIDLRKSDRGLAKLTTSSDKIIRIDDYKYQGAGEILKQILDYNPEIDIEGDRAWIADTDKQPKT